MNKLIETNIIDYIINNNTYQKKKERWNNPDKVDDYNDCKKTRVRTPLPLNVKRSLYLSALNNGRIKNENKDKLNQYNIIFDVEKNKYLVKTT